MEREEGAEELAKAYQPKDFEGDIYKMWLESGDFGPKDGAEPYTIMIPPPNVTGVLHIGHGLQYSLQDLLIRYERMQGKAALWMPGTDHAGIATQHVVEKRLKKEGKSRRDLGREAFVAETWKVKDEHHSIITKQLEKIGSSLDWPRERFTLDEGLSEAVKEVFVQLYEEGLIYRGEYLVNWCPSCNTALADDEVEHSEENGALYSILYPFADGPQEVVQEGETVELRGLVVATTRPETLFGDLAVAVHPEDERYRNLIGKELLLPLSGRKIPIIADGHCDPAFGTGAVKVTPAHDPNDWQIGLRHNLGTLNIINSDGSLNEEVPESYRGLKGKEARKAVVEGLKAEELLQGNKNHRHQVGHCYRCDHIIEPYLSEQWFVKMQPLAEPALAALENGDIRFYPARWANTYRHWMTNIRDWCISRQLWWGHRIPAWYCADCGHMMVVRQAPSSCAKCSSSKLRQDEDVLDTWFSSWLWPFSTLGWPEKTADLERFYPSSTMVTGYDIIFFWVARMVMAGLKFTGKVPFRDICLTPLVRDKQGRKMSKSLGNGIDPLEVIEQYGADALKFTIAYLSMSGQDVQLDTESFKLGGRFCNKVWNAARFLLMNLAKSYEEFGCSEADLPAVEELSYGPRDQWVWQRLSLAVEAVEEGRKNYRFDEMSRACYNYFWNDLCDWYVEGVKLSQTSTDEAERLAGASKLIEILEASLRLLHPLASHLTEEIYQKLPRRFRKADRLLSAPYPKRDLEARHKGSRELYRHFAQLQELVGAVRSLRAEFRIPPQDKIRIYLKAASAEFNAFYLGQAAWISALAQVEILAEEDSTTAGDSIGHSLQDGELLLYMRQLIDVEEERQRLSKLIEKEEKLLKAVSSKLSNQNFVARAPQEVVEDEQRKQRDFELSLERNHKFLKQLG